MIRPWQQLELMLRLRCVMQVNSFSAAVNTQHASCPLPESTLSAPFIAPYCADSDMTNNGRICYRNASTATTRQQQQQQVTHGHANDDWEFYCFWHSYPSLSGLSATAPIHYRFYRATACNTTHGITKAFLSFLPSVRLSVRPSVCLSVCQTRALLQNERNLCQHSSMKDRIC